MVDDTLVPLPMILRNVNEKNIYEIYTEIEKAKQKNIHDEKDYVIEKNRNKEPIKLFSILSQFLRLTLWKILLSNPFRVKKMMGTVIVTSVGMMGKVSGWLMPYSMHPLCFALGSIVEKPTIKNIEIRIREFLHMTILIDHDVVDGAPAARFVAHLVNMMENGFGL